jgi:hypothetical protein
MDCLGGEHVVPQLGCDVTVEIVFPSCPRMDRWYTTHAR